MTLLFLLGALPTASQAVGRALAKMDADGDGVVSAAEYAPFDERGSFAGMDQDHNGQVDTAELATWLRVTDPARNRPHVGVSTPGTAPAVASRPPSRPKNLVRVGISAVSLVLVLGLARMFWRRR